MFVFVSLLRCCCCLAPLSDHYYILNVVVFSSFEVAKKKPSWLYMPGTVPKSFDPVLVSSSPSSPQAPTKAAVVVAPSSLTTSPQPPSHPSSGVASLGASTAIANASHSAALSNGNPGAKMTSKAALAGSAPAPAGAPPLPPKDDEKEVALRKFVETSGHFSLVR